MNKKLLFALNLIIVIVLISVFPVVGCKKESATDIASTTDSYHFALISGTINHTFYVTMYEGAKAAADKLGIKLTYDGPPTWDVTKQDVIVRSVLAKGDINFLLYTPCDAEASVPLAKEIVESGIPIITVDEKLMDNSMALTFIASDNFLGGQMAAEALAEAIDYKGEVALIDSNPGSVVQQQRQEGFKDIIKNYPDIKIVATEYTMDDQSKASSITQSILIANPNVVGIYALTNQNGHGVAIGVKNADYVGKVKVISWDADASQVQDLKDNTIQYLLAQAPYAMGYLGVDYGYHYLQGFLNSFPEHVDTGFKVITKENLEEPGIEKWIYSTKTFE